MQWMPVLGWTPDVFWKASIQELYAAIDGYSRMNGLASDDNGITEAHHIEMRELIARHG
jgi:hypothetical protein